MANKSITQHISEKMELYDYSDNIQGTIDNLLFTLADTVETQGELYEDTVKAFKTTYDYICSYYGKSFKTKRGKEMPDAFDKLIKELSKSINS